MSPRTLVLMRHAKSDWSRDAPDLERPIGKRGRLQAAEAGHWLHRNLPDLEVVVTSPAVRARTTWDHAAAQFGGSPALRIDDRIYTDDAADLLQVLHCMDDATTSALLLGHSPTLDDLITVLTGDALEMVTSALAVMTFDGSWRALGRTPCSIIAHGRPPE